MATGFWVQGYPTFRRTQFSSCDTCRQSRVACDASKFGYQPGEEGWNGSCSRCALRNRRCTFEVNHAIFLHLSTMYETSLQVAIISGSRNNHESNGATRELDLRPQLHQILQAFAITPPF